MESIVISLRGGVIGDVLFFFCSGFALFFKPIGGSETFANWYKRRINRIFPSIMAVAFMGALFFDTHWDIVQIFTASRYWFISCIMIYYFLIFFVISYFSDKILHISICVSLATAVWFYFASQIAGFSMYDGHYIRWLLFFNFMLLGVKMCFMRHTYISKPLLDFFLLFTNIVLFYALFFLGLKNRTFIIAQYISFIPLMGAVYYFYKSFSCKLVERLYNGKVVNFIVRFVGGLCLEIYLVQHFLFTDKMNSIFPLNILIMFIIIVSVAYLLRCFARFISQTFKDTPYEWSKIVSLY